MDFFEFYKKVKAVDIDELKMLAVEAEAERILVFNKEQMAKGEDSTGGKIKPKYKSPYYARKKHIQNSAAGFGNPDIEVTRKLKDEMDVVVGVPNDKSYSIVSFVQYARFVIPRYIKAFALQKKNIIKMQPFVMKTFGELYKKEVGL